MQLEISGALIKQHICLGLTPRDLNSACLRWDSNITVLKNTSEVILSAVETENHQCPIPCSTDTEEEALRAEQP